MLALACLLTMPLAASAAVVFSTGTGGTAGTDNVLFNNCDPSGVGTGSTVSGCLNSSRTTHVEFTGNETLEASGGQARIEAFDGSFNFLNISLEDDDFGFNRIIFNINTLAGDLGDITITANLFSPGGSVTSSMFSLTNGQNFFNVVTTEGEVIQSLSFSSTIGNPVEFLDVRQVRLGLTAAPGFDVCPPGFTGSPPNCIPGESGEVPEPGSLALVGLALLAAGATGRRRRASAA